MFRYLLKSNPFASHEAEPLLPDLETGLAAAPGSPQGVLDDERTPGQIILSDCEPSEDKIQKEEVVVSFNLPREIPFFHDELKYCIAELKTYRERALSQIKPLDTDNKLRNALAIHNLIMSIAASGLVFGINWVIHQFLQRPLLNTLNQLDALIDEGHDLLPLPEIDYTYYDFKTFKRGIINTKCKDILKTNNKDHELYKTCEHTLREKIISLKSDYDKLYFSTFNKPALIVLSGVMALSFANVIYHLFSWRNARKEYFAEVKRLSSLEENIKDPVIANRIINVTSRLKIQIKDINLFELLDKMIAAEKAIHKLHKQRLMFISHQDSPLDLDVLCMIFKEAGVWKPSSNPEVQKAINPESEPESASLRPSS